MKRSRKHRPKTGNTIAVQVADTNLLDATTKLRDAVHDLTASRPDDTGIWIPGRYNQLRASLYGSRDAHTRSTPQSVIPAWIDAMKLLIVIDSRAGQLEHEWPPRCAPCPLFRHTTRTNSVHPTVRRIQQTLLLGWRPQDTPTVVTIATQLAAFAVAIDDLFAPKPVYLPNPCPHCGVDHTYRLTDDGQRIRTPALAVTAAAGAVCLHCHDRWAPDQLMFLGRILGNPQPEGVIA